jgi:hypothetical protein
MWRTVSSSAHTGPRLINESDKAIDRDLTANFIAETPLNKQATKTQAFGWEQDLTTRSRRSPRKQCTDC